MSLDIYLLYLATVGVFFASPPGPSQVLMISNSLRYGVRTSLPTVAGDLSANALQMTAAAFGLAAVVAASQEALSVVKWAGVAYLVWMGLRTFRGKPADPKAAQRAAPRKRHLYRQGFFTSAANPKAVVFFAALFPQFIDGAQPVWPQLLVLGATYIAVDGTLLIVWGSVSTKVLGPLREAGRWLNRVSGGLMIAAAGLLALKDPNVSAR